MSGQRSDEAPDRRLRQDGPARRAARRRAGARGRRTRRRRIATSGRRRMWRSTSRRPTRCWRISRATSSGGCRWSSARPGGRQHAGRLRAEAERGGLGVVASANFSIGVNVFQLVVAGGRAADAARRSSTAPGSTRRITPPSATRRRARRCCCATRWSTPDSTVRSTCRPRAPARFPASHTIGFDAASDTIELTHTARDRRGFAAGALVAARWIQGRQGWYSMQDVLRAIIVHRSRFRTRASVRALEASASACSKSALRRLRGRPCALHSPASAPRSSRRSARTARSTKRRSSGSRAGRSTPASTSSRRAARPAKRRR